MPLGTPTRATGTNPRDDLDNYLTGAQPTFQTGTFNPTTPYYGSGYPSSIPNPNTAQRFYSGAVPQGQPMPSYYAPQSNTGSTGADTYTQFQNAFGQLYGPEQAALQNQYDTQLSGLLGLNAAYGMNANALLAGNAADRAMLGHQRAGLGIDRAAALRQFPYLGSMRGFDIADINLGRQAANDVADRDRRLARSDATARGATLTPGHLSTLSDIDKALWNQMSGFHVNEQRTNTRYDESEAQVRDRLARLDHEAAGYGLQGQQLDARLQEGLAQLGLGNVVSVNNIMDSLASNNTQQAVLARQILEAALGATNNTLATGVLPFLPGMAPNLPGSNLPTPPPNDPRWWGQLPQ